MHVILLPQYTGSHMPYIDNTHVSMVTGRLDRIWFLISTEQKPGLVLRNCALCAVHVSLACRTANCDAANSPLRFTTTFLPGKDDTQTQVSRSIQYQCHIPITVIACQVHRVGDVVQQRAPPMCVMKENTMKSYIYKPI